MAKTVLIVGSGPTGMTAAIEMARLGFAVRIVDKADHMALHSQALLLQARTLEQMQRYGIAQQAVERGRKLKGARLWSEGKAILRFDVGKIPGRYPYVLFLPQTETERILNAKMEALGVRTERQKELVAFTQDTEGVVATLRNAGGESEEVHADWLLGCDGAHSVVRSLAEIPFEGAGVGISFFLGDLELEGEDVPDEELSIHLHRGDVVFMGRLTERWTRLIVAVHAKQDEVVGRTLTLHDFQEAIDAVGVRVKVRGADWMTPFRVQDRQAKHYRKGRVFLAGDASHIHSPVGGQGMNTGMQDVANLAWKLAAVERGAPERLLDSYEAERGEVGRALLRFTERGLRMATLDNALLEGVRDAVLPWVTKLEPVQRAALGFVSETAIAYRNSPAVMDAGGDGTLRAGDRVPDLGVGAGTMLGDWTEARHLAVLLDVSGEQMKALHEEWPGVAVKAVRGADLDAEGRRVLGEDAKLVLVRPDGYVGFRGPLDARDERAQYAQQDGLK